MNVIEKRVLSNGVDLTIFDESRTVAADRWFVKIRCVLTVSWAEWMDQHILREAGSYEEIRDGLEPIVHEIIRERNFVDKNDKDEIVESMLSGLYENIEKYMESSSFVKNCFLKKLQEWLDKNRYVAEIVSDEQDEDIGPADFSACFTT